MAKICPFCKKTFKDKAALKAHFASAHPNAYQPKASAPKPRSRNKNKGGGNSNNRLVNGLDLIGMYTTQGNAKTGVLIAIFAINPFNIAGTRMAAEASLWSRWRPKALKFTMTTSASSTTSGSYIVAWSPDPDFVPSNGIGGVRRLMALSTVKQAQIHESLVLSVSCDTAQKWLMVTGDKDSAAEHGVFAAMIVGPVGNLTAGSEITFTLTLNWSFEFDGPVVRTPEDMATIYAEDDYTPYFTTSTSEWQGGVYLTFKAHSGGSPVIFPTIQGGVVYALAQGAKVTFKNAKSVNTPVTHMVRCHDTPAAWATPFKDFDSASKYASSGDVSYLLAYTAAGDYCTPTNPPWVQSSKVDSRIVELENEVTMLKLQLQGLNSPSSTCDSPFQELTS